MTCSTIIYRIIPKGRKNELLNVILLGLALLFICGAIECAILVQEIVLDNAGKDRNVSMAGVGYTSMAITSGFQAFSCWFTPIMENLLGSKCCMCMAAMLILLYLASFIRPYTWIVYTASMGLGLAAAMMWNSQGNFVHLISTPSNLSRNVGLVWTLFTISLLVGNSFQYFLFSGKDIEKEVVQIFYFLLFGSIGIGIVLLMILKNVKKKYTEISMEENKTIQSLQMLDNSMKEIKMTSMQIFKKSFKIIATIDMGLLIIVMVFIGMQSNFISILTTCVGRTTHFGINSFSYIGLIGMACGVGEIFGSICFSRLAPRMGPSGRSISIMIACFAQTIQFFITFLVLPADSPYQESSGATYITPHLAWVLLCGFLTGLGDSTFNTQMMTFICANFPTNDIPCVLAIWTFNFCIGGMVMFTYAGVLPLPWQLMIISMFCIFGTLAFIILDMKLLKNWNSNNKLFVTDPLVALKIRATDESPTSEDASIQSLSVKEEIK